MSFTTFTDDRGDVLGRIDLAALAVDLGLGTATRNAWTCPSPTHAQTGKTPPVSIRRGPDGYDLWSCHGCGIGGTAIDLLVEARGLDVADAFRAARRLAGVPELASSPHIPRPAPARPPDPDTDRLDGPEADAVLAEYLERRRWSSEVADDYGLHVVRGRWGRPRVRHPYRVSGKAVWWQDRAVHPEDAGPKWDSPKGIARCLYAQDLYDALDATDRVLWIVEGPADVIALGHVLDHAAIVGIPGTAGLKHWAPILNGREVMILTDPDPAGDAAAEELTALTAERGGRSDRLRPPVDVDDWRRQYATDDEWSTAITAELDRQCPAEGSEVER